MSHIYDNWERLVAAAVRKHQLWEMFHAQSRSPSISSGSSSFSFSLGLSASTDDVAFGFWTPAEEDSDSVPVPVLGNTTSIGHGGGISPSSVLAKEQMHSASTVSMPLPIPDKNFSSAPRRRRKNLVIEVPKPNLQLEYPPCEYSSKHSPGSGRMTSPFRSSRTHNDSVATARSNWSGDGKHQSYPLPLPPASSSAATSPSPALSPGKSGNRGSPGPRWKKGQLLGGGSYGNIYLGFNSETGEMCAIKEFMFFPDDANSKRNAKKLEQEIALLSRLKHPNIVQYYGSETVGEKVYVYFEYVSGGSIGRILQQYGKLGESAIRSYTQQILLGLACLHSKNTMHRNIKADSLLFDPSGRVKLADFGIAKHITRGSDTLPFDGSPYWMAPEFISNSSGCNQAVDIWSLGCTILEMATSRPPWSQYIPAVAMFKIIQAKELPEIPDNLSDECKHFVRICLQWNPQHRPTASQLLDHPFMKSTVSPLGKQISGHTSPTNSMKSMSVAPVRNLHQLDSEVLAIRPSASKPDFHYSDIYTPRNLSRPISPAGSPLMHPLSPQLLNGTSPSPLTSPHMVSRSSTPSPRMASRSSSPSPLVTSGASTPDSGEMVTYRHHPTKQSTLSQAQTFRNTSNQPASARIHNYWDPSILQGMLLGSHPLQEKSFIYENEYFPKKIGTSAINRELYEQTALVDRVAQQPLRNPVKVLSPSRQFSPSSQSSPGR